MEEGDGIRSQIEQQFNPMFPEEFQQTYICGFDDYKKDFTPNQGLFSQVNNSIFEYNARKGMTYIDIILISMYMFKGYEMPHSKNKVTTEEQLDIEVNHFYFLSKYNLL